MSTNEINEKELVYQIICDSTKPMKLEEIVSQIFDKYNGYVISKINVILIIANEIKDKIFYDKIKQTYSLKESTTNQADVNKNNQSNSIVEDRSIQIDGYTIILTETINDLGPLFWIKVNGFTMKIYLNLFHSKSNYLKSHEGFLILVAICRTSVSFSDDSGQIFLNKLKNYIELI